MKSSAPSSALPLPGRRVIALIVLALMAAVLAAYSGVASIGFSDLDDSNHVYENALVRGGLTAGGLGAAFTAAQAGLWVPLTTASFMLDVSLWGLQPAAFHCENVLWHAASAALLFYALFQFTGRLWPSAMVAGLFGLHPINVESVVWITERKNVLCGFFVMLTLVSWGRYLKRPHALPWLGALGAFALALLAKPMAVPLPFALLLLDWWPARRTATKWRLIGEKLPFFLLSIGDSLMAMRAALPTGGAPELSALPLAARLSNALIAYGAYLKQLFWPANFAVFYPHPLAVQWGPALAALGLLIFISATAWWHRRTQPWLLVGWAVFLGMLVPSIGLIQAGMQARADRFTYLAQTGIFIAVVWTAAQLWPAALVRGRAVAAALLLCGLAALTVWNVDYWTNPVAHLEHSLQVTGPNLPLLSWTGTAHARRGEWVRATQLWRQALEMQGPKAKTWNGLGETYRRIQQPDQALECFRTAVALDPLDAGAKFNLALSLETRGARQQSIALYREGLKLRPTPAVSFRLGLLLEADGDLELARDCFFQAGQGDPGREELRAALERVERAIRDKQHAAPPPLPAVPL